MNTVNAIAKVRFGSARPQRVTLDKRPGGLTELLCLEPGQTHAVRGGQWCYYVITSSVTIESNGEEIELPTGQFAAGEPEEDHALSNRTEQRVICLAFGRTK